MENSIEVKHIKKAFVGVQALDDISFCAVGGEVCSLVGENGAGKSTLLKILFGNYQADEGEILINGEPVQFNSPLDSIKAGMSYIAQERQLVPDLTVTENVFMEDLYHRRLGLVDFKKSNAETQELLNLFEMPFSPKDKVSRLSVAYQQMVEIIKAYRRNSQIIAFDEPTAPLSDTEIEVLFKLIRRLKEEGKVILYVSHRMNELFRITDKLVILKDGKFVEEVRTADVTEAYLISKMTGRDVKDSFSNIIRNDQIGDLVLEAKNLKGKYVHDVSFQLHKGEVLGFAGLVGAGRSETMQLLFGADKIESGEIYIDEQPEKIKSPKDAIRNGIGLCPEDRKEQGLVLGRSISDNLTMPILNKISRAGFINRGTEKKLVNGAIEQYRIKTHSASKIAKELSGGNQQKVIVARWMLVDLKVLILDEPTKGIDVGAKSEIYQMVCDLAKKGLGVIFISSELPEIINICDNVVVMNEGYMRGTLSREELSEERILTLAMKEGN